MGLLDNALQALKSQYEETKGNVGLLVSDPKRYMSGLNQDAAEYNRLSSLALQAERNAYRGIPVSQEQAAAKQYIDQQQQDMALAFAAPIAYHGSPHTFNKFDLAKMGTGEGQQMIAPGVYLSESKDFAKGFMQDQRGQAAPTIASKYLKNWGDNNLAIQKLDERYKTLLGESSPSYAQPYKDAADMLRRGETDFSGSLYKVDLPDSKARRMLDYDKELKSQPKHIRNLATQSGVDLSDTGFDLLQKVGRNQDGADKLKNAGITGVKYSNEMTPGTSNYVVFDPSYLNILERNKKPVK